MSRAAVQMRQNLCVATGVVRIVPPCVSWIAFGEHRTDWTYLISDPRPKIPVELRADALVDIESKQEREYTRPVWILYSYEGRTRPRPYYLSLHGPGGPPAPHDAAHRWGCTCRDCKSRPPLETFGKFGDGGQTSYRLPDGVDTWQCFSVGVRDVFLHLEQGMFRTVRAAIQEELSISMNWNLLDIITQYCLDPAPVITWLVFVNHDHYVASNQSSPVPWERSVPVELRADALVDIAV